ncbi:MAG: hypothetical protein GY754_05165 [bacterium]|nr:hypothetical protein [bacterium]
MPQDKQNKQQVLKLPAPAIPDTASEFSKSIEQYNEGITVDLNDEERESLVVLLKEIILNLPLDPENGEEFYCSDVPTERGQFRFSLYGFEMRALRTLFSKVR